MDDRCIGVFDSGLGGLTVVKELSKALPDECIVYFGDTGRVPYGTKSKATIVRYTKSDINFLKTFDLKLIIAACGTASSLALPEIEGEFDLPIFGVVEPTVKAAVNTTKNKKIGVIATPGTIKSGEYEKQIKKLDASINVINKECPMFVPLVENDYIEGCVPLKIAADYLECMKKSGVDTLILGCTHYPLLTKVIQDVMGENVTLINSGRETAKCVKEYLQRTDSLSAGTHEEKCRFYVSDEIEMFSKVGSKFLGWETAAVVEKIDIEKY
ncbi:MAG: glutamate racemase [Ruminococcaceae bacterium]|nr:glutamate racemase [Oscillospiraceae bacterium]